MKLYTCSNCSNLLYFENSQCLKCGHLLGFDPVQFELITLTPSSEPGRYHDFHDQNKRYRFCENARHATCNWLTDGDGNATYCIACVLNRTIPTLHGENLHRWKKVEIAKHRLVYTLLKSNLPVKPLTETTPGITFNFLESQDARVMTGHNQGVVTLNIEEADETERVRNKVDLRENYRTLLGHFRHEIGHYYWDVLIKDNPENHHRFRELFGDESRVYDEALKSYYANGPKKFWQQNFISAYATSHPWEDWAETWAHYLHMMDTIETAYFYGIGVHPKKRLGVKSLDTDIDYDPFTLKDFDSVMKMWLPLTFAVNSLNRSMGHSDFYPFVIAPRVVEKLKFIHNVCQHNRNATTIL